MVLLSVHKGLPVLVLGTCLGEKGLARSSSKIVESLPSESSINVKVSTVYLGPGFLQKHDPELVSRGGVKSSFLTVLVNWELVIKYHIFPHTVDAKGYAINSFAVGFSGKE